MSRCLKLPAPPSANRLFVNRKHGQWRAKGREYKAWQEEAMWLYKQAHKGEPLRLKHYMLEVRARLTWRRDFSNIEKALNDFLQLTGEIEDDRYMVKLDMELTDQVQEGHVLITWRECAKPY